MRLSTLTGVPWLNFIPVYFTNHTVLECIFFVLVTSQGVFILLAFICNKRVFTTFKNKIHRKRPEINSSKYTSHNKDTSGFLFCFFVVVFFCFFVVVFCFFFWLLFFFVFFFFFFFLLLLFFVVVFFFFFVFFFLLFFVVVFWGFFQNL